MLRDRSRLIDGASFSLRAGELVAMLGPNGAGKTTLLRAALGLIDASEGSATLGGKDARRISIRERALRASYLPQRRPLAWPSPVRDVVALGRYSHGAALGSLRTPDRQAVDAAIEECGLVHLAHRASDTLSGGELARVHLARAFAAQAPLLLADEPVAALDPGHQLRAMNLVKAFVERGGGALVVMHDIEMAARYADRLVWLCGGRVIADGSPQDTLTEARLADVYGVAARVEGRRVQIEDAL